MSIGEGAARQDLLPIIDRRIGLFLCGDLFRPGIAPTEVVLAQADVKTQDAPGNAQRGGGDGDQQGEE